MAPSEPKVSHSPSASPKLPNPDAWRTSTYYRYWMHMAHGHNNPAHFGLRTDRYKLIFFYGCDFTSENDVGSVRFQPVGQ